jgi:hypothetical protein
MNAPKDLGLSAAAFAGTQWEDGRESGQDQMLAFGRLVLAFCIAGGVWYTGFIVGLEFVPAWIPGHTFWAYVTAAALIVAAGGRPGFESQMGRD